jgi:hypothetical protein
MSNIVEFNPQTLPSFVKRGAVSAVTKALAGEGGGKRISIKGGVFRLYSAGEEIASIDERFLDVVIVHAAPKVSRTFYMGKYEEGKTTAPDCWSPDGERPSPQAEKPQSSTCASCPQNIAGSGDGTSRACRYSQRLAVVLENDMSGDVMQLSLPAQSIFGKEEGKNRPLQAYARYMAAMGAGPDAVVTRLKFDTKAPVPKLFFEAKRWLTDDEYAVAVEKGQTREAINAVTMTVAQTDTKSIAQTEVAGTAPKATKPKIRLQSATQNREPEDDGIEPEVRKEAVVGKNVPKAGADLSKIVDAWDDTDD